MLSQSNPFRGADERVTVTSGESAPSPGVPSGRHVLENHWRKLSPETEQAIREHGIDLDAEVAVPPWESVSEAFRKELGELTPADRKALLEGQKAWPSELSVASIKGKFPVLNDWRIDLT